MLSIVRGQNHLSEITLGSALRSLYVQNIQPLFTPLLLLPAPSPHKLFPGLLWWPPNSLALVFSLLGSYSQSVARLTSSKTD